jgi:hypothetical protein
MVGEWQVLETIGMLPHDTLGVYTHPSCSRLYPCLYSHVWSSFVCKVLYRASRIQLFVSCFCFCTVASSACEQQLPVKADFPALDISVLALLPQPY